MAENFVKTIQEYIEIDDQIRDAQKDIQLLKARKQNIMVAIMAYMKSQEWDVCNISSGGKLMLKKSKTKVGVKRDTSEEKLAAYFGGGEQAIEKAEEILKLIFDERDTTEKDVLRRTRTRDIKKVAPGSD
tara:strand:- start:2830 stop:3219 length:390 start_codon:yes stop_codon:yes gene_type:complete